MKLRMKIMSGFLILAMMLAIAGVFSIYEFLSISSSVKSLLEDNYKSVDAAKKMIEALEKEDGALLLLISGKHPEEARMIRKADVDFLAALETAKNNCTLENESGIVEDIGRRYQAYKILWTDAVAGAPPGAFDMDWYFEHGHTAFLAAKTVVDELMALNDANIYRTATNLQNRMHRAIMPGIVAIAAALVFSFIFIYFINHYFVSPIIAITKDVQNIVQTGNPSTIEIETNDELKDLAAAIHDLSFLVRKEK